MRGIKGMKKIWKIMILCMILCFFCAGCSNDDEMISEDHPKPTTEKRTEIIKQKTTQKKNEVTVDQEQSKQQEDRIKIAIDAGHQKKQMSEKEAIGPGSDKTKPMVSSGTEGVVTKRTEYQVNLEVSLKLKSALIARGYNVYMIRETNDVSLSNKKRALMANESGSDILLRIHCNSVDSQSANGALTMSPTLSNPYCVHTELISCIFTSFGKFFSEIAKSIFLNVSLSVEYFLTASMIEEDISTYF